MMPIKNIALLVAILFIFNGCVFSQMKVPSEQNPNNNMSYVYGNYAKKGDRNVNISIVLTKYEPNNQTIDNAQEYYIAFGETAENEIHMIEVQPGTYNINKIANLQKDGFGYNPRGHSKMFRTSQPVLITIEPNKAYYLGDYVGFSTKSCIYRTCTYRWKLLSISDTEKESTNILRSQYRHFNHIQTKSLLKGIMKQGTTKIHKK